MTALVNARKTSNRARFGVFQLLNDALVAIEHLHQVITEFTLDRPMHDA